MLINTIKATYMVRFTHEQVITCLNNIGCSLEQTNLYMFDYRSHISDCIGEAFNIDFTKKY